MRVATHWGVRLFSACLALGLCLGCDSAVEVSGSPAGPEAQGQFTASGWHSAYGPMVLGIVVDDVDDAQGEEARTQFVTDLKDALTGILRESSSQPIDPGRFEPIDIRVVLAFPSFGDLSVSNKLRFVSWVDHPDLHWHEDYRRAADIDRVVYRAQQVLQAHLQPLGSYDPSAEHNEQLKTPVSYMPIGALRALTKRLYATFCPSFFEPGTFDGSPAMEHDAPPDEYSLYLTLYTGRDDFNTPFGWPGWEQLGYVSDNQAGQFMGCFPLYGIRATTSAGDLSRLRVLADEIQQADLPINVYDLQRSSNPLWLVGGEGWRSKCSELPYDQDENGNWLCKYEVIVDAERCDEARGWRDSVNPTLDPRDSAGLRVCEVHQLVGADRERCETDFECQDCTPGWCIPTLHELRPNECSVATTPWWQFRLVGPSNAPEGRHRVTCMR